ncbi:Carboxylate-amine ligase YbdK [Rubripirellula lacrimiformis]|uniref:Putative glutamate--cysteine ligase 2 n=1 Tax=Rubripirellula lacrimiformis TaxID=1930273 RepID=A0A517NC42_9BACT|nr:glutamate--cysteine ligase [Rubripirellula lacrimiformis]QDT04703.1 Carboxylate-amine ligase YbdK [Rubripirellula lacrimiformis]
MNLSIPSVGVEEEYQLVDPTTGLLLPNCREVMQRIAGHTTADIQHELHLTQIEMASAVCDTLDDVRNSLKRVRGQLIAAAKKTGAALVATGTNPHLVPQDDSITPKQRYRAMRQRYQQLARDLLIFGCHVHVSIQDRSLGMQIMNMSRRWLPVLQALSSNSPFWDGVDSGYASYRRELWAQWPMAGPPPYFDDLDDYQRSIDQLTRSGAIEDESYIYWDIRLSTKVPTIEFRGADVMMSLEETVGYTGLVRAIVMQVTSDLQRSEIRWPIRSNLLSYAIWQSARYGLNDELVDPLSCQRLPARDAVAQLLEYVGPSLDRAGDRECVEAYLERAFTDGTGADRQRAAAGDQIDLAEAVRHAIMETAHQTDAAIV